jgi:hypothetical protein
MPPSIASTTYLAATTRVPDAGWDLRGDDDRADESGVLPNQTYFSEVAPTGFEPALPP